jgi:hypothetical protein
MINPQETKTFATPSGPITATTQTVDPVPQEVAVVAAAEIKEFEELALACWDFVAAYLGRDVRLSLESLDEAFRAWQTESSRQYSDQRVVQILGAYLGQRLTNDLDMEWVTVVDEYGTDYAVRSRRWEVLSFPFAAVSKRIENYQCDFMVAVYQTVEHTLKNGDHMPRRT